MSVIVKFLVGVVFSIYLVLAVVGLYTLVLKKYVIGGRRFGPREKFYIYPQSRPGLFVFLIGIFIASISLFCFVILAVLHST